MKTALIYSTMTGHSKKIANAIANQLQIQAENIKTNPQLQGVDLLFIVGGIYGGKSQPKLLDYVNKLDSSQVKKVALITSCASNETRQEKVRECLIGKNIEVVGEEYICKGSFLFFGLGHPNKTEIENSVEFAKTVFKKQSATI